MSCSTCSFRLTWLGRCERAPCPTHAESTASAALHPDWAQGVARLHKAFSIPVGSGLRVQKGYRWEPDENKRDYYVLDLAVLRDLSDGKVELVLAIEVQQTHANSSKKREAFKEHDIPNVQISAPEVQSKCGPGLAFAGSGQRLEVNDYPDGAGQLWLCPPCLDARIDQEKRELADQAAAAAAEAAEAAERAEAAAAATPEEAERAMIVEAVGMEAVARGLMAMEEMEAEAMEAAMAGAPTKEAVVKAQAERVYALRGGGGRGSGEAWAVVG